MDGSGTRACIDENITGTFAEGQAFAAPWRAAEPCGFVVAEGADGVRFCDAPALRGASYCAHHRGVCQVAPGTPEGAAIVAELAREAERPPLPGVGCDPLLELEETDPEDALAALDLSPRAEPEEAA